MEYDEFTREVMDLNVVRDPDQADAAVKAVLGILASRLKEPQAEKLTQNLPEPLTLEKLRSHQKRTAIPLTVDEYVAEVAAQFKLSLDEAQMLIETVLGIAKENLDDQTLDELESNLPDDWADLIHYS